MLAVGCTRSEPAPQKLTVYCSVQLEWCELAVKTFEEKTGIHVSMTRKSAGETLAQITAERKNPRGDVWFGGTGDAHVQAAEMKLTEPYASPRLGREVAQWGTDIQSITGKRSTGIYMGTLGFAYSSEWLAKKGLPAPKRWADLLDPAYRGEIQVANPTSSGTAYTLLATWMQLWGEDRTFEFLKALDANVNQYTLSGSAPVRAVARGETGVGIVFLHDALIEKAAGYPIVIVSPEDGTGFEIGCVSIVHGARHLENAERFVDWALTADAQELGPKAHSYQWPSNYEAGAAVQESLSVALPKGSSQDIELDLKRWGQKSERAALLDRWEREVKGGH